jgi:hypothetical protein
MKNQEEKYQFINPERYDQYIANLPPNTQLRFISKTSLNGDSSYTVPMPHNVHEDYTILVPYYLFKSYLHEPETIVMGFAKETGEQIARKAIMKETCYRAGRITMLGDPIPVKNSRPEAIKPFEKNFAVATDYYYNDKLQTIARSKKIGEPVWVHNSLLAKIFEIEYHPQKEAYARYMAWLSDGRPKRIMKNLVNKVLEALKN